MVDLFTKKNLATLANFASSNVLVGFDYDGTLAPIVSRPARARMRAVTRRLLSRVAESYPCVVISGRSHDDLVKRLGRLPLWHLFGNHGLEPWAQTKDSALQVHDWVRHLRDRLAIYPGLVVEDKKYSVTVHYRHVRDKGRVRQAIAKAVRALSNVRALGGDQAVNLILRGGPDKGVALQRARRVLACETAIYVGDDETDEDAFTSAPPGQLLAIRVGDSRASRARYRLRRQADIDTLLEMLLKLRGGRSAPAGPPRRAW